MEELSTLASCGSDNTVRLWASVSGNLLHIIDLFKDDVTTLDFCISNNLLYCGSYDKTARSFCFNSLRYLDQVDYLCLVKLHSYFSCEHNFSKNEALEKLVSYMENYSEIYTLYNFDIISLLLCFDCEAPLRIALVKFGYPFVKKISDDPLNKFFLTNFINLFT